jgi:hypothetical protein
VGRASNAKGSAREIRAPGDASVHDGLRRMSSGLPASKSSQCGVSAVCAPCRISISWLAR